MLNQTIIVGRIKEFYNLGDKTMVTVIVPRSFKNENGEYESDFIDAVLCGQVAENTTKLCEIDDIIGIKGRLTKTNYENTMSFVAEKVTFLSNKKED